MNITVRRAVEKDCGRVSELLESIAALHHDNRPDIYIKSQKYTFEELTSIFNDKQRPVFVATDENDEVIAHCFCIVNITPGNAAVHEYRSLYIDDFCVSQKYRGFGVGSILAKAVIEFARDEKFPMIDLNVWEFNETAIEFYKHCGFTTQRRRMEMLL